MDSFNHELLQRLHQLPGAEAAGLTNTLPTTGEDGIESFVAEGYVDAKGSGQTAASPNEVIGEYFRAMGFACCAAASSLQGMMLMVSWL